MSDTAASEKADARNFFVPFRPLVRGWFFSGLGWAAFFFALGLQIASALNANAGEIFRMLAVPWLAWSVLSPVLFRAVDRWPVDHIRSPLLLLHVVAALALSLCLQALRPPRHHHPEEKPPPELRKLTRPIFGPDVLVYFAVVGVAHAFSFYRRSKERELRTVELAASLAEARLQALRMQLQPHFLFNSLNAIAALMHEDPDRAEAMIEALADFLRLTLRDSQGAETTLRQEIEFVKRYLEIEKIRFGDRLVYRIDVPEETLGISVPVLLLQPLVENSVTHGIEQKVGSGEIVIEARVEGDRLRLTVRDNGLGLPKNPRTGVGLTNIRERLRELHGDAARFHISSKEGTTVEIELPRKSR